MGAPPPIIKDAGQPLKVTVKIHTKSDKTRATVLRSIGSILECYGEGPHGGNPNNGLRFETDVNDTSYTVWYNGPENDPKLGGRFLAAYKALRAELEGELRGKTDAYVREWEDVFYHGFDELPLKSLRWFFNQPGSSIEKFTGDTTRECPPSAAPMLKKVPGKSSKKPTKWKKSSKSKTK